MKTIKLCSILGVIMMLSACEKNQTPIPETLRVEAGVMEVGDASFVAGSVFAGSIESTDVAELSSNVMAPVILQPGEIGTFYKKGDVLVRLDDTEYRAAFKSAKAVLSETVSQLEIAEADKGRFERLFANGSATKAELEVATSRFLSIQSAKEQAEASVSSAQRLLEYTVIKAPFDGYVSKKYVQTGSSSVPGMPLVSFKSSQVKVVFHVPESGSERLKVNDEVGLNIPKAGILNGRAKILRVNQSANSATGQFRVEAFTDNNPKLLKPGMFAEVLITNPAEATISIPNTALAERGQLTGLYVVNEQGIAMLRWVKTGKQSGESTEILSGLRKGERIVINADEIPGSGVEVVIKQQNGANL